MKAFQANVRGLRLPFKNRIPTAVTAFAFLLVLVALAGCNQLNLSQLGLPASSTQTPTVSNLVTHSVPATTAATPTAEPAGPQTLTLWVPPQFDPNGGAPGGALLNERLAQFESENPGVEISVRVKAQTGPGGLLDTLTSASAAAPAAVPALIALPRADLESAALKGLIYPLDELSTAIDQNDWFPFAQQLALVQGATFGLPFVGDAQVLLYRPARVPTPPTTWEQILQRGEPLAFAASDPQALVTLNLYAGSGGTVEDVQGRPTLDAQVLGQVLQMYENGAQGGTFPAWLAQYQTDGQAWQAYIEERTPWVVNWASRYLAELPPDTNIAPLPSLSAEPFTLATGWLWALSEADPERQKLAVRLAEFLTDGEFLAQWSEQNGHLPTRPSALSGWQNQSLRTLLNDVVLAAEVRPRNELVGSIGPAMQAATIQILQNEGDAAQVAQAAAEKLGAP
ncbi:MAG TPA: extracellular solute-binding protein [Anaerolineaceae bacterium]|nr:extracellular solute-binding protein [Anaerolineaceae bacterium]